MKRLCTTKRNNGPARAKPSRYALILPVAAVFVLAFMAFSVYSWFYGGHKIAAVSEVADPAAIFINAGNREDIRYLDLGGIDVEGEDDHRDFVFCVRGSYVSGYKIQLAFTTNNQFEYELYPASLTTSSGSVPNDPLALVVYETHEGPDAMHYYYASSGASPLAGSFLNQDSGADELLAKTNDTYYAKTYTPSGAGSTYDNRHKYAVPLYWQGSGIIHPDLDANYDFCDYFILRVKWSGDQKNNKETDIVYISAKNVSA